MLEIQIIDLSVSLKSIKKKYGEKYYFEKQAYAEAASLWGFTDYNDCGVILRDSEIIAEVKSCKGEAILAESSKGHWLMGCSAQTAVSGFGFSPAVFDSIGFASYEDAKAAATKRIIEFFERERVCSSGSNSDSNKANITEVLRRIKQAEQEPEFDLFAPIAAKKSSGGKNALHR